MVMGDMLCYSEGFSGCVVSVCSVVKKVVCGIFCVFSDSRCGLDICVLSSGYC